jgi:polysaccharide biosynthesis transport protein
MTFTQLFQILKARRLSLAAVFAQCVLIALIFALVLPKKYTASAMVVIDSRQPDPVNGLSSPPTSTYMNTQMDIVRSMRVVSKVITALNLDKSEDILEQWQEITKGEVDVRTWLAGRLLAGLDIKPSKDTSVLSITYTAVDPKFAALLANQFVKAYIETNLELRVEPAKLYTNMFEAQLAKERAKVDAAQSKLSIFQNENDLISTDERLDIETTKLNELSAQLVGMQSQTADSQSRSTQAGLSSPELINNSLLNELKASIAQQESQLSQLNQNLGPKHPQIATITASIAELKSKLASESATVMRSLGVGNAISKQREAQIQANVALQRSKVLRLKSLRDKATLLSKDLESAQRSYDGIQARLNAVLVESQNNQTNISIIQDANAGMVSITPKFALLLAQGIFVGLVLGVTTALIREARDRRIRASGDVTSLGHMRLLGVMPAAKADNGTANPLLKLPKASDVMSRLLPMNS